MYRVRATYLPRDDMKFDYDYYFREHVALAQRQTSGKLNIVKIEVETEEELLLESGDKCSPLVFIIHLETLQDVDKLRQFFQSPDIVALQEDVPKYTNCELKWTVSKLHEIG